MMRQYDSASLKQLETRQLAPHIYWATALARKAIVATQVISLFNIATRCILSSLTAMCFLQLPQAIVISGESGSGKTVNTSHIVDFLCSDLAAAPSPSGQTAVLSRRLRHSGALFESLGNACTLRNNNSRLHA